MKPFETMKTNMIGILALVLNMLLMPLQIHILIRSDIAWVGLLTYTLLSVFAIAVIAVVLTELVFKRIFVDIMGGILINSKYEKIAIYIFWLILIAYTYARIYDINHYTYYSVMISGCLVYAEFVYFHRVIIHQDYLILSMNIFETKSIISYERKDDATILKRNAYVEITLKDGIVAPYRSTKANVTKLCEVLDTYISEG